MKQEKNNEIDLLLQSLARGKHGEPLGMGMVSGRVGEPQSDHLDTDELSSFAEGVLPAPARVRYVAHLADCGSCRASVISLMRASGATARSETLEPQTGAGFWQNLAAIFSPAVLRYAVPAIAFTVIIAISFFALRERQRSDFVSQNRSINSSATASADRSQTEPTTAQPNVETPAKDRGGASSTEVSPSRGKASSQDAKTGTAPASAPTPEGAGVADTSLKDSAPSKQGYVAGAVTRPAVVPESQAAPPPPPAPAKAAVNGADKLDTVQKEEVSKREAQGVQQEAEKNQPRDEDGRHGPSRSNNATLSAVRRRDGLINERAEPKAKSSKDADDEIETRTVSGKRFRHEGSVWIDTAYDSSQGNTNVWRGSDRFRALIADEPGIRTIAEKLSGVVIVVWSGRAYRIH